jgi:hypothetical protein
MISMYLRFWYAGFSEWSRTSLRPGTRARPVRRLLCPTAAPSRLTVLKKDEFERASECVIMKYLPKPRLLALRSCGV